eukprot:5927629-Amphidinium_carterae.1
MFTFVFSYDDEVTPEELRYAMSLNCESPLFLTTALYKLMEKQASWPCLCSSHIRSLQNSIWIQPPRLVQTPQSPKPTQIRKMDNAQKFTVVTEISTNMFFQFFFNETTIAIASTISTIFGNFLHYNTTTLVKYNCIVGILFRGYPPLSHMALPLLLKPCGVLLTRLVSCTIVEVGETTSICASCTFGLDRAKPAKPERPSGWQARSQRTL